MSMWFINKNFEAASIHLVVAILWWLYVSPLVLETCGGYLLNNYALVNHLDMCLVVAIYIII